MKSLTKAILLPPTIILETKCSVEYRIITVKSIVSIVKCDNYEVDAVHLAVERAMELAELTEVMQPQQKALLKPNLLSTRPPEQAVTTHPSVIRAVGALALSRGCELAIGDSPPLSGENPVKYEHLCEVTGVTAVSHVLKVPVHRFEEDVITVNSNRGVFYKSFELSRVAAEADLIINIPKLKTHGLTGLSGAVKNLFGCVPGIRKGLFHAQAGENRETFSQMLVDLLRVVRPRVNVMDAIIAMEGEGPNSGSPRYVGVIMASSDPVALDAVASAIISIDPMSIATTRLAQEEKLGCGNLVDIEIRGEKLDSLVIRDFKQSSGRDNWIRIPSPIRSIMRRQLVPSPVIMSSKCSGCGECSRVCPVKAITPGKPPKIDLSECIRCYCCHEVCPKYAIDLKRGWLGETAFRLREKR